MRPGRALPALRLGEYHLERLLGVGGMAEVYVARRHGPHGFSKRVALKRILPQLAVDPRLVAMFCDEARIHASLSHPNLLEVLDFGEHAGELFMVLEYVDGLSCSELIQRVAVRRRAVDLGPALYIAREVLAALAYAHAACDEEGRPLRIVHRDVAPSNVLLGCAGEVKLGDFGIVRCAAIDARTSPGELKGKIGYVSPEQALGLPLDARSDLFSLGVLLAELLICQPLFPGNTELEILESLHRGDLSVLRQHSGWFPEDVTDILLRALARRPGDRFQSAAEMAEAIERVAHHHGQSLGAHMLAEWLSDLGLVRIASDVHAKPASSPVAERPKRISDLPFSEAVTLSPSELDAPAASLGEALARALPDNDRFQVPTDLAHAVQLRMPSLPAQPTTPPPVVYQVRSSDTESGASSLAELLGRIATGQLSPDAEVSRSGGPYLPLRSVVELGRLASRPAYRFSDPVELVATFRIPVLPGCAAAVLFTLARQRQTGLVVGRRAGEQIRIYLEDGVPVFTASTEPDDLLGNRLIRSRLVSRVQVDRALELGWRSGLRLGDALVEAGVARPGAVLHAVSEQRASRLAWLFGWHEGELCFQQGACSGEDAVVAGNAFTMVSRALLEATTDDVIRHLVDASPLGWFEIAPEADSVVSALGLPLAEAAALDRACAGATVATLIYEGDRLGLFDERAARRALFVGFASGVLVRRG